ncbi:hypothetical protein BDV93DRAFT_524630 [Ceratobasidium sp. AG-I]|nr:hypothetical protein BDV93DRAFT_524630 [Ceratobasidium sp. AG-I]
MATPRDLPLAPRVFCLPEIARLICGRVGRHDQTTLMRVCRQLYSDVIPLVWEFVQHLFVLLDIIPGIETRDCMGGIYTITKRLPDTLDLTRFNIYAPHVRILSIGSNLQIYENLDGLQSISRSTTLLPNLSKIFLSGFMHQDLLVWMRMFILPSLNDIWSGNQRWSTRLSGQDSTVDIEQALHHIATVCPSLKSLDIYPATLPNNKHPNSTHNFFTGFCHYIRSFDCLRELSTNTLILEHRSFLALGRLPALESLTLYPCAYDENASGPVLPEDTFLALRRLDLQMMNSDNMAQLCGLKPLVQRLTTLGVLPHPSDTPLKLPSLRLDKMLSALAKNNRSLSSLLIGDNPYHPAITVEVDSVLLQWIQHFPLKQFTLSQHIFLPGVTLKGLLEVLPTVEELSLGDNGLRSIELQELRMFASRTELPNLRVLDIMINFMSAASFGEADFDIPPDQSLASMKFRSNFNQVRFYKHLTKPVARFLHTLWPNVICAMTRRLGIDYVKQCNEGARLTYTELVQLRRKAALE